MGRSVEETTETTDTTTGDVVQGSTTTDPSPDVVDGTTTVPKPTYGTPTPTDPEGDGLSKGPATADVPGDVLGI